MEDVLGFPNVSLFDKFPNVAWRRRKAAGRIANGTGKLGKSMKKILLTVLISGAFVTSVSAFSVIVPFVAPPQHDWTMQLGGRKYGLQSYGSTTQLVYGARYYPNGAVVMGTGILRVPLPFAACVGTPTLALAIFLMIFWGSAGKQRAREGDGKQGAA